MVHMYHILGIFIFFNLTNVALKYSIGKIFSLMCAIFYKSINMCSFDIIEKLILLPAYTSYPSAYTFDSCMKESTNGTQVNVGCQASCVSGTLCQHSDGSTSGLHIDGILLDIGSNTWVVH